MNALLQRIASPGRKRILALDGGGTRGIVTVAFLERMEELLREKACNPGLRLCDHFDLVGGTSTGSIIATAVALGYSAGEVARFYRELTPKAFKPAGVSIPGTSVTLPIPALLPRLDTALLEEALRAKTGERSLDSPDLLTGLAIIARRFDTASTWLVTNNPRGLYWDDPPDRSYIGNRHYKLLSLIRASTAAPTYFAPEFVSVAEGEPPAPFIDGGLSAHNNPALYLLMAATLSRFGFGWLADPGQLSLVSVGTGTFRPSRNPVEAARMMTGLHGLEALMAVALDAGDFNTAVLQWLSEPRAAWQINSEMLGLEGEVLGGRPLIGFQRYDIRLESDWIEQMSGKPVSASRLARLRAIDNVADMNRLYDWARHAAEQQVRVEDLG
jgi:predicted acylesterase/phospholipase RssA